MYYYLLYCLIYFRESQEKYKFLLTRWEFNAILYPIKDIGYRKCQKERKDMTPKVSCTFLNTLSAFSSPMPVNESRRERFALR